MFIRVHNGICKELNNTYFNLADGKYKVTVVPFNKATEDQFGYWYGVVCPSAVKILRDLGWDVRNKGEAHVFMKDLFFKETIINEKTGEVKTTSKSFSTAKVEEISVLYEEVWRWANELGYDIQRPSEYRRSSGL